MLTQEIRGLGFPFSHELLLHTASFLYFCRSDTSQCTKGYFDRISICCFMRKHLTFYRLQFRLCGAVLPLQTLCLSPQLKLHTAEPIYLSGLWDVCTHNTFIVLSLGHINDYHPSSYLCSQRSVWRCGAHAVRDHGLNRLRPFSRVRYDIAAWCLMGLEKVVNMSSTLWIPLHKEVDLQLWVH